MCTLAASAADVYTLDLLPLTGAVQGAPGSTIGWGYELQNQSTSLWLVPVNLSAGAFQNSTPELLFTFPVLAPSSAVTQVFDQAAMSGLYQLTWDSSSPIGLSEAGNFTLQAQWWNGDPLAGGVLVSAAPVASVPYVATVTASSVPEPSTFVLLTMTVPGLLLIIGGVRRSGARVRICG
jgi:hypothetical protein